MIYLYISIRPDEFYLDTELSKCARLRSNSKLFLTYKVSVLIVDN